VVGQSLVAGAKELVQYRDLIRNLVVRDLRVRYKNSVLGFAWSLLNPLGMMIIFTVVFTIMLPYSEVEKFPVFVLCALLPWNWFSASVIGSTGTIVGNAALVKKVYFPREVLPISVVLSNLVNFLLALIVLFAMIVIFRVRLTGWALLLPVVIFVQMIFTMGVALFLSTLNVFYRDTQVIMEVVMLAWFFVTPVFYPVSILPQTYTLLGITLDVQRLVYILNPMASIIATYRVILYAGAPPALDFLARTTVTSAAVLACGYLFFARYAKRFAEEL
jgi:lipopolysaccharide transport system permease protein